MTATATSANLSIFRQNLVEKVAAAQQARAEAKQKVDCAHEFKRFKQTVREDNVQFAGSAYFVVRACIKCHLKEILNYVIVRK